MYATFLEQNMSAANCLQLKLIKQKKSKTDILYSLWIFIENR